MAMGSKASRGGATASGEESARRHREPPPTGWQDEWQNLHPCVFVGGCGGGHLDMHMHWHPVANSVE